MDLLQKYGFGDSVKFCFCDVREEEQVAKLVDFTVDSFGTVDILINSAATWNYAHLCDLPREDLERVMDTNVNGAFFLVKYVSRYMIDHKIPGKMVFIASNSPWMPYPVFGGYSHYAASKGAVVALATQAAKELKRYGIMVNAVAPGGMVTPALPEIWPLSCCRKRSRTSSTMNSWSGRPTASSLWMRWRSLLTPWPRPWATALPASAWLRTPAPATISSASSLPLSSIPED